MRILVTGVTGQIGSAIATHLSGFATVIPADRSRLDLARPQQLASQLDALSPDLLINPAAYTAVDRAEDEVELAFIVNATGPAKMAEWAANRRVPLIHFSTDYVFSGSGDRPWCEDDQPAPINAYGASKLAGEEAIRSAGGDHLIVRTSWVYAANGSSFLRTMTRLMQEQQELRIVADQYGGPTSADYVAATVADIVRANSVALSSTFAAARGKVHVAASGITTWHAFADAILDGLRRRNVKVATRQLIPITTGDYPTRAVRPRNSRLDLSRLREVFRVEAKPWRALLDRELDKLVNSG